jgi:hypothetical protein
LISAGADKTARLWDVARGRELARVEAAEPITSLALSPDATRLATGDALGEVRVWDTRSRKQQQAYAAHAGKAVSHLVFSPNGLLLFSGGADGIVLSRDLEENEPRDRGSGLSGEVTALVPLNGNERALAVTTGRPFIAVIPWSDRLRTLLARVAGGPPVSLLPPEKTPVPPAAALTAAVAAVRVQFKADYAAAQAPARVQLAIKLLRQARETPQIPDRAAERFALLQECREVAAKAGDPALALEAVESAAKDFDFDADAARHEALTAAAANTRPQTQQAVVEAGLKAADAAVAADRYEAAGKLLDVVRPAAPKANTPGLVQRVEERARQVRAVADEFAKVADAARALEANASDPSASLALGKFRALVKGDWAGGLALLKQSADPQLAGLADKEASANGMDKAEAADAWWGLADPLAEPFKTAARDHAKGLYRQALAALGGEDLARAEERLKKTVQGTDYRPGLVAEFFPAKLPDVLSGKLLKKPAAGSRMDYTLDIDFQRKAPVLGVEPTEFLGRWSGYLIAPKPGRYKLVATANDRVRVTLNNRLVMNTLVPVPGRPPRGQPVEATVDLTATPAALLVELWQDAGNASIHLSWHPPGAAGDTAIPAEAFWHTAKQAAKLK